MQMFHSFYVFCLASLLLLSTGTQLVGCGSTYKEPPEKALERQIADQEREKKLASERAKLRTNAEAKIKSGDLGPPHPTDPGFPIMRCLGVKPVPFGVTVGFAAINKVVCGNSEDGSKIVAYREWYCGRDNHSCIVTNWKDGQPSLEFGFVQATTVNTSVKTSTGETIPVSFRPFYPWPGKRTEINLSK